MLLIRGVAKFAFDKKGAWQNLSLKRAEWRSGRAAWLFATLKWPGKNTTNAEQTYFAIRGGKAQRVDAQSAVEAASVCGGKSHFAAKLRICPWKHAEASRDLRHDVQSMRIFKSKSF
ncbi:hypothetical protein DPMN_002910 [Dreissena polymorpha]|uniref:Uncharacterized protein n=1 Tax=Dreissena polymorpha TaxID=45954 RepID=A0A9D4MNP7_DREPO|nr:hypothetical protein DPMN_002910 [Dreissena polymorpha]